MTTFAKTDRNKAAWWVVDASQEVLGRMATRVSLILQGKHKPTWTPHADVGDFVVVVNAEKIQVTGRKRTDKLYRHYTGNHGGMVAETFERVIERRPTEVVKEAVRRMLPKTDLARHMLSKLKVYAGPSHPHSAQDPKSLSFGTGKTAKE